MNNIITYIEEQLNAIRDNLELLDASSSFDAGAALGKRQAYTDILERLHTIELSINADDIYETLKNIRYDKNGSGQFSATVGSEFTDYALRDISRKLYLKLLTMETPSSVIAEYDNKDMQVLAGIFNDIHYHPVKGTAMKANLASQFSNTALTEILEQLIANGVTVK